MDDDARGDAREPPIARAFDASRALKYDDESRELVVVVVIVVVIRRRQSPSEETRHPRIVTHSSYPTRSIDRSSTYRCGRNR